MINKKYRNMFIVVMLLLIIIYFILKKCLKYIFECSVNKRK